MAKQFTNRYPNVKCSQCNELIAIGAPMKWSRRNDQPSQRWHVACYEALNGNAGNDAGNDGSDSIATTSGNGHSNGNSWLQGLAEQLAPWLNAKMDKDEVEHIIESLLQEKLGSTIFVQVTTVKIEDLKTGQTHDLGVQHRLFPILTKLCMVKDRNKRLNIWLTGPAGSGKTTAVENAALALGLKFYHVGAMDNEYKLLGFIDAQGRIVNTQFKDWWQNGGVICLDEIDSWLPAATLALNAALANGHCTFPDGMIKRHPDAVVVACANTWGLGSTTDYVGRMKQDAAFLDRFVKMDWGYDEAMETAISGNVEWAKRVQALRAKAKAKGLKVIISPRATVNGAALLAHGVEQDLVEELCVRQAMTAEQWGSIQ